MFLALAALVLLIAFVSAAFLVNADVPGYCAPHVDTWGDIRVVLAQGACSADDAAWCGRAYVRVASHDEAAVGPCERRWTRPYAFASRAFKLAVSAATGVPVSAVHVNDAAALGAEEGNEDATRGFTTPPDVAAPALAAGPLAVFTQDARFPRISEVRKTYATRGGYGAVWVTYDGSVCCGALAGLNGVSTHDDVWFAIAVTDAR